MGVCLEPVFLAAVSSASLTAWIVRLLSSSISWAFAPNALLGVGLLKMTVLCGLGAPIDPVCGAETLTMGVTVESPLWNVEGSTRPSGCWYGQVPRVQPAPNRQGVA